MPQTACAAAIRNSRGWHRVRPRAATVRHVTQGAVFTDEELLAVLDRARGDQRVTIVLGLRISAGSVGVARLLELVDPEGGERTPVREQAMLALGDRMGAAGTDVYLRGLTDRSMYVRHAAVMCVVEHADASAAEEFFRLTDRRLRSASRLDYVVQDVARYAMRVDRLPDAAAMIRKHEQRLDPMERDWLTLVWPAALDHTRAVGSDLPAPDPERVGLAVHPDHRSNINAPAFDEVEIAHIRNTVWSLTQRR